MDSGEFERERLLKAVRGGEHARRGLGRETS